MARIPLIDLKTAAPEIRAAHREIVEEHGVVTNMKATLLHSPVALRAVLGWYDLFAQVKPYLGERLAVLFCDAISRQNRCELCATFMRRAIIESGEVPEQLELSERDMAVSDYGKQLAANPNRISDALFERLSAHLSTSQIVELTTFGALMIVNNVVNSALQVDLDSSLEGFRIQPEVAFA